MQHAPQRNETRTAPRLTNGARRARAGVVIAGLLLGACGSGVTTSTERPIVPTDSSVRIDEHHYLGVPFTVENLTVWPVHTDDPLDVGEFLTLQEAQARGVATVREIGGGAVRQIAATNRNFELREGNSEPGDNAGRAAVADVTTDDTEEVESVAQRHVSGSSSLLNNSGAQVNTLVIENRGSLPLLVCAGTIVKGGNQDRQIGQDIVVAAGATVPVDAFCVEQGRWTNVREGIANGGEFVALNAVASKGIRTKGQFLDDQSGVWEEVAQARVASLATAGRSADARGDQRASQSMQSRSIQISGTTLVDSLDKADDDRQGVRTRHVDALREHFHALLDGESAPVGFAYAVNGQAEGVRVFAHDRLFRQNLESFAMSLALEAEAAGGAQTEREPATADDVVALVQAIEKDAVERREETRASNFNVLLTNGAGFNGNCYYEAEDGKAVPVTRDWTRK